MLRTHCQTSGWSLTEQDPYNNVVRTTIEAMAAVFGGTQSLHTNSLRRGDRAADRLLGADRPQHPADPPGGDAHHQRRRPAGPALHDGEADAGPGRRGLGDHRGGRGARRHDQGRRVGLGQAARSRSAAAEKQARIDSGEDVIVGVNKYRLDKEDAGRHPRHRQRRRCASRRSRGSKQIRADARRRRRCEPRSTR